MSHGGASNSSTSLAAAFEFHNADSVGVVVGSAELKELFSLMDQLPTPPLSHIPHSPVLRLFYKPTVLSGLQCYCFLD